MFIIICLCALLCIGTSSNVAKESVKFPPEATAMIKAAIVKCIEQTGVTRNILDLIKEGKYLEDDAFKKYTYCAFQESGYAKPDGHIILSKAVDLFPKEINIAPVIENCDKQGKDPVETTFLSFKCFQDTSPVLMSFA